MLRIKSKNANDKGSLLCLLSISIPFFLVSSKSGETITETSYIIGIFVVYFFIVSLYMIKNGIDRSSLKLSLLLLCYLTFATIVTRLAIGGTFNIARLAYVVLGLMVFCTTNRMTINRRKLVITMTIISIVILVWNTLLITGYQPLVEFTLDNYSQFSYGTTEWQIVQQQKPIFTLGVHSFCCYFYSLMFAVWFFIIQTTKKASITQYILMFSFLLYMLLVGSSTAFAMSLVSIVYFIRHAKIGKRKYFLIPIFLIAVIVVLMNMNYDWERIVFGNSSNGFLARYGGSIFNGNIEALKRSVVGIGFCTVDSIDILYTDSGYIVLTTMGSIVYPIIAYYLLAKCIKRNVPSGMNNLVTIMILAFEIGIPSLLYPKSMVFMVFVFIALKSLSDKSAIEQQPSL